jgi:ABC-type proline/glycine betaine transport system substrate-binding protein
LEEVAMNRIVLMMFCAAAVFASPADAAGEFKSGNEIKVGLEGWVDKNSTEYVRDGVAFGYVLGVHDTLAGSVICSGDNVTQGQVIDVVLKFMRQNPEILDRSADQVVAAALKSAWPCADT